MPSNKGRKITVLILTPWFPNEPGERNGSFIFESFTALRRYGVDAQVLVCRPWLPLFLRSMAAEWMRGDINVAAFDADSVKTARYLRIPKDMTRQLNNKLLLICLTQSVCKATRKGGAHIVHAHTEGLAPLAAAIGRKMGIPTLVTIHGENTDSAYLHASAQRKMFNHSLNSVDRVLLVGESLRRVFREITGRDNHFYLMPNGVRLENFTQKRDVLEYEKTIEFISVSNLHEGKGVDITLNALAQLHKSGFEHWHYTVVGDGDQRLMLENLVRELGLSGKVFFAGLQPNREIPKFLAKADVFVLPSYREAFGIAYIEAMAMGLVAIGVRGQGPQAFIQDGKTGFLIESHSIESLVDSLKKIIAQPAVARDVAQRGKEFVCKNLTWDAHAARLHSVYADLIAEQLK